MLLRINHIKSFGVFESFTWPDCGLEDFATRNLFYGWNYAGKTTLSRVLRSIEKRVVHPDYQNGRFDILAANGNEEFRLTNAFEDSPFHIRVFNSDYVAENLQWQEGVDPILVLGEHSRALQKRRERLEEKAGRVVEERSQLLARKRRDGEDLDRSATNKARDIKLALGVTPFNRSPHLDEYINSVSGAVEEHILDDHEYEKSLSIYKAEERQHIPRLELSIDPVLEDSLLGSVFETIAVQNIVEALRSDRDLELWVERGLSLHLGGSLCQFCGADLPEQLLERLSEHFSDAFKSLNVSIDQLVKRLTSSDLSHSLFEEASLYQDLRTRYRGLRVRVLRFEALINQKIGKLISELEKKKQRVGESYQPKTRINKSALSALERLIDQVNEVIDEHNTRLDRIEEEKAQAKERLLLHMAACFVRDVDWVKKKRLMESASARVRSLGSRKTILETAIRSIDEKISEEALGALRLNSFLRRFFGKDDIQVSLRDDKMFTLERGGVQARNLSEGERTAISFSYFLAGLEAKDIDLKETVVFIDDPVSSLDSNHLFNTYSVIKTMLGDARQLFISTHDFAFFRLMKSDKFFAEFGKKGARRRTSYYYLSRSEGQESHLGPLPSLIQKYNSEYHFLFSVMYEFSRIQGNREERAMSLPNIVRRVLEAYSSFRLPGARLTLDRRLLALCDDEATANRIYKFVNHLSHSDSMDSAVEFPGVEECDQVVAQVLDMMKKADPLHFKGMVELCGE